MTQKEIMDILEKHHPLNRADILQLLVSKAEMASKPVPTIDDLMPLLQKMLDTNRIYIFNAPDERDLSKFPLHVRPAKIELASRRQR